jgi:hypothetical protein
LASQAAKIITPLIQAMVPIMAPGRITVEAQSWSPSGIDLTIEVPDIGRVARITSGGLDTGVGVTTNRSGSAATMSSGDTDPADSRANGNQTIG